MPAAAAWWRCGSWQWDGLRWLRRALRRAGQAACRGKQWNWTLCCQRHGQRSATGQLEGPEAIREKQFGGWDIGFVLFLHHRVPAGLLIFISDVFSVCAHYFIWDLLITPNLEKPVLFLWSSPWKLTCISEMETWTMSLLTNTHLQHDEILLFIFTFVFLIFCLHSLNSLSNPSLSLPHFMEDSTISILFLDLNYFGYVSLWLQTWKHFCGETDSIPVEHYQNPPRSGKSFSPVTLNPPNSKSSNHTDKTQEVKMKLQPAWNPIKLC